MDTEGILKMQTAAPRNVWHGIEIPAEFEPGYKPTVRRLQLKLSCHVARRKWEFYFWADRTPKLMQFHLFTQHWEYLSEETLDTSKPRDLAFSLLAGRASVGHGRHFLSIDKWRHTEGMQVLEATLRTLAEQLGVVT